MPLPLLKKDDEDAYSEIKSRIGTAQSRPSLVPVRPKEKQSLEDVFRVEKKLRKNVNFYLTGDEQKSLAKEALETTQDIFDKIDSLVGRPFYAVTGAMAGTIRAGKKMEGKSFSERLETQVLEQAKGAVKGAKREERLFSRDLFKMFDPETMDWIEKNTSLKEFGKDEPFVKGLAGKAIRVGMEAYPPTAALRVAGKLGMDAASVPTFLYDVALDPLTWIPFGAPLVLAKAALENTGKLGMKAAGKVIGEAKVAKLAEMASENYYKSIAPRFDARSVFRHEGEKVAQGGGEKMVQVLDNAIEAMDYAKTESMKTGERFNWIPVTDKGTKQTDLVVKMKRMTDVEDRAFYKGYNQIADDLIGSYEKWFEKKTGLSASQIASARELDDLLELMGKTESAAEKSQIKSKISSLLSNQKAAVIQGKKFLPGAVIDKESVVEKLMADKGTRNISQRLASLDKEASLQYVDHEFAAARLARKEARNKIASDLTEVEKTLKAEHKVASALLVDDVSDIGRSIKELDGEFLRWTKDSSEEALHGVREGFSRFKARVNNLNKYMTAETKSFAKNEIVGATAKGKVNRSEVIFGDLKQKILGLESAISQAQLQGASEITGKTVANLRGQLKSVTNDLKFFRDMRAGEFSRIKGSVKATSSIQKDLIESARLKRRDLLSSLQNVENEYKKSAVRRIVMYRRADRISMEAVPKYEKAFSMIKDYTTVNQFMKEMKTDVDHIFEAGLKKYLPEELHDSARRMRNFYNDWQIKLGEIDDPLLRGGVPLYMPRIERDTIKNDFFNAVKGIKGGGRGFLKHRKFAYSTEFESWMKAQGVSIEDRAAVLAMDYTDRAMTTVARENLKKEVLAHFGKETMEDLPKNMQMSFNWMFNTFDRVHSPWGFLTKMYGKAVGATKFMLTVPFPAFQVRNWAGFPALSSTTAGMRAGWNPTNLVEAMKLKTGTVGGQLLRNAKTGEEISLKAFGEAAEKTGYYGTSWFRGQIKQSPEMALGRGKHGMGEVRRFFGKVLEYSQNMEDIGRLSSAVAAWKSGNAATVNEALKLGKKAMFDYNLVANPTDRLMQSLFGFYVFPRKNFPRQFMTLFNQPSQYSITVRTLDKLSNREKLTEEEFASLNNFERQTFKVFGDVVDGVRYFRSLGFFPMEDANQTLNVMTPDSWKEFKQNLGSRLTPVALQFLDFWYGKESFTQKDFGYYLPPTYTKIIPNKIAKYLGFTKRTRDKFHNGKKVGTEEVYYGDPDTIGLVKRFPITSRVFGELNKLADPEGADVIGFATGARRRKLDLEQRKFLKKKMVEEALIEESKKRGGKEFKILTVPKVQKRYKKLDEEDE